MTEQEPSPKRAALDKIDERNRNYDREWSKKVRGHASRTRDERGSSTDSFLKAWKEEQAAKQARVDAARDTFLAAMTAPRPRTNPTVEPTPGIEPIDLDALQVKTGS